MPSELFSKGLAYMLVMAASKGSLRVVEAGLRAGDCGDLIREVKSAMDSRSLSSDEFGYGVYGALVLMGLRRAGVIKGARLSDVLREALYRGDIEDAAHIYAEWIKRLVEAYMG